MDNLKEMEKFLEKYNIPKLKQEEIENLKTHHKLRNQNCNQKSSNKPTNKQKKNPQDQMAYSSSWFPWPPEENKRGNRMAFVWGRG